MSDDLIDGFRLVMHLTYVLSVLVAYGFASFVINIGDGFGLGAGIAELSGVSIALAISFVLFVIMYLWRGTSKRRWDTIDQIGLFLGLITPVVFVLFNPLNALILGSVWFGLVFAVAQIINYTALIVR